MGEYSGGKREGYGYMILPDGGLYEGQFKADKFEGQVRSILIYLDYGSSCVLHKSSSRPSNLLRGPSVTHFHPHSVMDEHGPQCLLLPSIL